MCLGKLSTLTQFIKSKVETSPNHCGGVLPPGGVRGVRAGTIISIFILSFLLSGCADFFKPEDYSFANIQNYDELEQALGGIMDNFRKFASEKRYYNSSYFGDDLLTFYLDEGRSTGGTSSDNYYGSFRGLDKCQKGNESFKIYLEDWQKYYTLIISVNNALIQYDLNNTEDKATRIILGELYFYRALFYYRLTHVYGRIPLIDDIDVDYAVKRPSYTEVYEFIEADLLQAIQLLPANQFDSRIPNESPNRGAAKALLGEVYLNWAGFPVKDESKYSLAMQLTGEVIDSASYFGYELLPDFEDLWNGKSYYNNEAVFCNYYRHNLLFATSRYLYYALLCIDNPSGFGIDPYNTLMPNVNLMPEIEYYNQYPKSYRKDITFFTRIYAHPNERFPRLDTGYVDVEHVDCKSRAAYRKFLLDTAAIYNTSSNSSFERYDIIGCQRIYILRFAQTLLTYAEARAHAGKLDDKAYEYVNKIRRRAHHLPLDSPSPYDLQPGLSVEAFVDSVVQERAWEFAGEQGYRWYDMLRTQIVEKVYEQKDPNDVGSFKYSDNDQYFFPIPQGDVNLNPNLGE